MAGNHPLSEADRKDLSGTQLLTLVEKFGIVLTAAEQSRLSTSQLLDLAKLGQSLTESSRSRLNSTQKLTLHEIALQQAAKMTTATQKPLFLSHASVDKELVDGFVDLLVAGAGVNRNDIFCTSLEQMGVPLGENFVDFIKSQIQSPEIVLMMVTENYLESRFCLCEMGACWALSHKGIPIVVPPVEFADLDGVVTATQAVVISNSLGLSALKDVICERLGVKFQNSAIWEKKRDAFISGLKIESSPIPTPPGSIVLNPLEKDDSSDRAALNARSIEKVVQFLEAGMAGMPEHNCSDQIRRLFDLAHQKLQGIYEATVKYGLPYGQLRETMKQVEKTATPRQLQSLQDLRWNAGKSIEMLQEHHAFLMLDL
jgi:hypothetical protein